MARYATGIMKCEIKTARAYGKYFIVGSVPGTCVDERKNSKIYETEADALAAILDDPWIQATPEQMIQLADCSVYNRQEV